MSEKEKKHDIEVVRDALKFDNNLSESSSDLVQQHMLVEIRSFFISTTDVRIIVFLSRN